MADNLVSQLYQKSYESKAHSSLLKLLETSSAVELATYSEREEALLGMLDTIASLVDRMQNEAASEPLYATA
jgi:multidrug resistance protein MdtO